MPTQNESDARAHAFDDSKRGVVSRRRSGACDAFEAQSFSD